MDTKFTTKDYYKLLEDLGIHVEYVSNTRRYWFIRTQGGEYFDEFFLDGFVGIGDEDVPCIAEKDRSDELLKKIKEGHPQATRTLNQIYKFCKEIHKGDIVIIPSASSAQFAFGIIEEDEIYKEPPLSEEDEEAGKCPYTRRRKTHWIQGIPKSRVDSKLYSLFRNQQKLSNIDSYSDFIERALHSFYVKEGKAHFTLSILTRESPNAFDMPMYIGEILARAKSLYKELGYDDRNINVQSRTNVQSVGLSELLGDPVFVALVSIVIIGLFGGTASFIWTPEKGASGEVKTNGLAGFILSLYDRIKGHVTVDDESLKQIQNRLRVEDPRKNDDESDQHEKDIDPQNNEIEP